MNAIPNPIVIALRKTIRRVRMITLWRGLGAVAVVALGSLMAIMAVDAGLVLLNPWPRYLLTILAYAATAFAAVRFLVRPLARSFSLSGMARIIDMHHPEMQERLSSAVELLTNRDGPDLRGSEALINALAREAARDAQTIRPGEEVNLRIVAPFTLAAMALILVLAVLLAVMPRQTAFLLARAAIPFLNLPNVYATELVVTPGDAFIAAGAGLTIQARVKSSKISGARLRQRMADGTELRQDMNLASPPEGDERRFVLSCTNLETGFRYQIHAGNALSRFYSVQVVHPPAVQQVDIRYDYPAYSRLEPVTELACDGAILALAGTRITVSARLSQPAPFARAQVASQADAFTVTGSVAKAGTNGIRGVFTWILPPGIAGSWAIRLRDKHGIESPKYERTIMALPDRPPVAKILRQDRKELRLNTTDQLPVDYAAEDDWGLQRAELLLETDGRKLPPRPLAIGGIATQAVKSLAGQTVLDMSGFTNVQRIRFQLRVADTLPESFKGPQFGLSETYTIILDTGRTSYERQALDAQEQQISLALQSLQGKLSAAKDRAQPLPEAVSKDKALSASAGKQLDQMRQHLAAAEATARDMAERTKDGFYTATAESLRLMADTSLSRAASLADQIKLADAPAERSQLATNVLAEIDKALASAAAISNSFALATAVLRDAVDLGQLAKAQRELASAKTALDRAAEVPPVPPGQRAAVPAPPMTKEQWQKAEEQIAGRLAEMVKKDTDLVQAVIAADQKQASLAAAEAGQLAQRQSALSDEMKRAAEAIRRQNQDFQELANQQDKLAVEAKAEARTAPQAAPMRQAAEKLKAGHIQEAIRDQNQIAATLSNLMTQIQNQAQDGGQSATPTPPTVQPQAEQDRQAAAGKLPPLQAVDKARLTAQQAGQMAEQARQAAQESSRQAQQIAQQSQEVVQQAKLQPGKEALANALAEKAETARQAFEDARRAAQRAAQAAQQAKQETDKSMRATAPKAAQLASTRAQAAAEEAQKNARQALDALQAARQARESQQAAAVGNLASRQDVLRQKAIELQARAETEQSQQRDAQMQKLQAEQAELGKTAAAPAEQGPLDLVASRQDRLARRIEKLRATAALLQAHAGDLGPKTEPKANQAMELLNRAKQQAAQAAKQIRPTAAAHMNLPEQTASLDQAQPKIQQAQQASAQALQQAAQTFDGLGKTLAIATPAPATAEPNSSLLESYLQAVQAADSRNTADAARAAETLERSAQAAAARARDLGTNPNPSGGSPDLADRQPGQPGAPPENGSAWVAKFGSKLRDWLKLPGELPGEVLQADMKEGPEEYRQMIQQYFHEVSKQQSESE